MSRKFSCFPFLQTIGLLQSIFCRIGKGGKKTLFEKCITPQHLTNITATSNDSRHSSPNTHFHMHSPTYILSLWYETVMEGPCCQQHKCLLRPSSFSSWLCRFIEAAAVTQCLSWQYKNYGNSNILPTAYYFKHYAKCAVEPSWKAIKSHTHSGDLSSASFPLALCEKTYKIDI